MSNHSNSTAPALFKKALVKKISALDLDICISTAPSKKMSAL